MLRVCGMLAIASRNAVSQAQSASFALTWTFNLNFKPAGFTSQHFASSNGLAFSVSHRLQRWCGRNAVRRLTAGRGAAA